MPAVGRSVAVADLEGEGMPELASRVGARGERLAAGYFVGRMYVNRRLNGRNWK